MYLLAPFIVQNLKTNLRADPELSGCAIFGHKWPICPKQKFLVKNIKITFM